MAIEDNTIPESFLQQTSEEDHAAAGLVPCQATFRLEMGC